MLVRRLSDEIVIKKKIRTNRGNTAFSSTFWRSDASFDSEQLSQVSADIERKSVSHINKTMRKLQNLLRILYLQLDLRSTYTAGYADAAFANNPDNTSQLGYIVLLKDKTDHLAMLYYTSWKCQRVTRSALDFEVHAFSQCFDFVLAFSPDISKPLQKQVSAAIFTDSKCAFDTLNKLINVQKKRRRPIKRVICQTSLILHRN